MEADVRIIYEAVGDVLVEEARRLGRKEMVFGEQRGHSQAAEAVFGLLSEVNTAREKWVSQSVRSHPG